MSSHQHPSFHWALDQNRIVTVTMDTPGKSVNAMSADFLDQFSALVDHLVEIRTEISGVILTSAKKTFCAGGDLDALATRGPDDIEASTADLRRFHRDTRLLETLGRPVVAALNGTALGGGFELALSCHHRITVGDRPVRVGLPEITFGLLPGGGGTVRTARLIGLLAALDSVLLPGRAVDARTALSAGLIDEIVDDSADLLAAATAWIEQHPDAAQPWDRPGYRIPGSDSPALAGAISALPAVLRKQSRGPLSPATRNIIAACVEGSRVDIDTALAIESRYFAELAAGTESSNLIAAEFFDRRSILAGANRPTGYPERRATRIVVAGAGMMGAGIALVCAQADTDVVLYDVDLTTAERGKDYSRKVFDRRVDSGKLAPEDRTTYLDAIRPTADPADAAGADVLIEAVFEDPAVKQRVLASLTDHLAADAVIASNTSTIPITDLAASVPDPSRFIGTHFFSPVDKMELLEIVVGEQTSDATLARAIDLARQIGKLPVVVNDSRGFFTSRVITAFVDEAVAMVGEGIPAASVEQAATQLGYPVGPLALVDEISLTLTRTIRDETLRARRAAGEDPTPPPSMAVIDSMIDTHSRHGRAAGGGFYDYDDTGRRVGLWPGLGSAFGSTPGTPLADLQERLLFAEVIEARRCQTEGVLRSAAEGNVASLVGIGFPRWTGGVLRFIDSYDGGPAAFEERARELSQIHGPRFVPPTPHEGTVELIGG
ncbi:3-hydroxyacyl-CoA dehydrogenase NAD-binding domain-containing protein [Gordonia polyisoprenivorans]|uniref:3-hydroxyacyl-CoA dehydrogenase NAD-binding domain-containing protein n=1 Tax=Gordonia polyisoprenivorans TaxID=84595 RepID=UPI001AD7D835|nr:3-hydroxyacyl-CoA dehydrogenase NAD-binding domain-containing protein [Gordonia polyisoprenivorans]QTI69005.1 enoyl-CoA hydratase/isomerase family protein [Gordonia polyisoprenivorans]